MLEQTGETEDEAGKKRVRKKSESKKRDTGTPVALTAELTPLPGSHVRGPRKSATCFFRELREELQCAPAVTPLGYPSGPKVSSATVSPTSLKNNRGQVEVIEFHSGNKKRRQKLDPDGSTKVMNLLIYMVKTLILSIRLYRLCQEPQDYPRLKAFAESIHRTQDSAYSHSHNYNLF